MRHGPSDSEAAHQAAVSKQATESSPVGSLRGCPLARARTLMACAFIMIRAEVTVAYSLRLMNCRSEAGGEKADANDPTSRWLPVQGRSLKAACRPAGAAAGVTVRPR